MRHELGFIGSVRLRILAYVLMLLEPVLLWVGAQTFRCEQRKQDLPHVELQDGGG